MRNLVRRPVTAVAALAAVLLLTVGAAACGDEPRGSSEEVVVSTTAPGQFDAIAGAERVPGLIREHLGEGLQIRRLHLSRTGFTVQVRDRDKPDNMDDHSYETRGGVIEWTSRPVSVSVSEIADYEAVTFRLSDISFDEVPHLVQQALDGLDLEGEEIGVVGFDKLAGDPPRVYISVNGLRGSGRLIANADGTEVDIQRN